MAWKVYEQIKMPMVYWLARRLPHCKDMTQSMSESLDHRLPVRGRIEMKLHLWICDACARYLKHLLFIREVLRQQALSEETTSDVSLSAEARERMKRALRS